MPGLKSLFRMVLTGTVLVAAAGRAHHPLGEAFDRNSAVALSGIVSRLDWGNPHVTLVLDVDNGPEAVVQWLVEMDPPGVLLQRGWTQDSIAAGQRIAIEGFRALDGGTRTVAKTIRLENGEVLLASSEGSWSWQRL